VIEDTERPGELEDGLRRSRGGFMSRLRGLLTGDTISPETWAEVEETLIAGDVGASLAMEVVERARQGGTGDGAIAAVRRELEAELLPRDSSWDLTRAATPPAVVLIVGVNGTGKTTTIGKLATRERAAGKRVILAAADTFRAAAADQLRIWAERADVEIVSHAPGADPAAVVYDALDAAVARGADVVIVDTAGRLHTKTNLMDELAKIRRVIDRRLPGATPETLLVLDATTGQNGLAQAAAFHEAVGLTGIVLTKLDSTSRGGIVFAIEQELGVPVRYAGVGERPGDLVAFDPATFVAALFEVAA
jgi:fused signal recognition particle receptor